MHNVNFVSTRVDWGVPETCSEKWRTSKSVGADSTLLCINVCMYACECVCVCIMGRCYICARARVCERVCMYMATVGVGATLLCINVCMYVCMYVRMYVCM